jgi:hypothetical protein
MSRTSALVVLVTLTGLAYRGLLAAAEWPMSGDPVFSYCYRALLIAAGDWRGVYLMWHPPGYPLLLGGLTWAGGGLIDPYWWGLAVSLASYVGTVVVVDRLVAPRAAWPGTRVVVAGFLAFYETLALWAAGPLTEPVYLFLIYAAVLALDRDRPGPVRGLLAGLLVGVACTVRLEGAAPTVGLMAVLLAGGRAKAATAAGFVAGWLLGFGWLLTQVEYLSYCRHAQQAAYTIPPAQGVGGNVRRLVECAYFAVTQWLPFTLLLPYWLVLAAGLLHPADAPGRGRLHRLLLAVVVPSLLAVAATIMHKRTGSFLLPAAAVWVGLGCEVIADRLGGRPRRARLLVAAAVLAVLVADLGRTLYRLTRTPPTHDPVTYVAAAALRGAEPGPVWAFGGEPAVYAFLGRPVYYPFREQRAGYNRAYWDHVGRPDEFVSQLRAAGFRYLAFALRDEGAADGPEPQPVEYHFGGPPARSDLTRLRDDAPRLGLTPLATDPADGGRTRVYVFRIAP